MANTNDFSDVELGYPIIVTLQSSVNKYYPGSPAFTVPLFMKNGTSSTIRNTNSNIINSSKSDIKSSTAQRTTSMSIKLPKEYSRWYPTKIIPVGTKFICVFINGDINKPYIIGRYDN